MSFFKLKAGSHMTGEGLNTRFYSSSDPLNNVVESDFDLAKYDPGKFERVEKPNEPTPARGLYGLEPPPAPASPEQRQMEAMMSQSLTAAESRARAQQLREMADQLEKKAAQSSQAASSKEGQEWSKAAQELDLPKESQTDDPMHPGHRPPNVAPPPLTGGGQAQPGQTKSVRSDSDVQQQGAQGQQGQQAQQSSKPQSPQAQEQKPQGQGQQTPKFSQLPPEKQRDEDAKLERMNLAQLREMAEEEEVEVPANASKAQLLHAIRQARK